MARQTATRATSQSRQSSRRDVEDAASMAFYIADMASELAQLASNAELQMVAYFLNLARVEAEIRGRELGPPPVLRETKVHSRA